LIITSIVKLAERFRAEAAQFDWAPRYNAAPAQVMPVVVVDDEKRRIVPMKWGLVPSWSRDGKMHYSMINAKAETLWEKPSFKNIIGSRRCLIPADGFYEWIKEDDQKIPFRITKRDEKIFGFAGIWDEWRNENGKPLQTFSIITTDANDLLSEFHNRMPVILRPGDESGWLSPDLTRKEEIEPFLKPCPSSLMRKYRVSQLVNSWKNDSSDCIKPV